MSHGAVGADVEELQRLAQQFDHAATRLQQLAGTVGNGIRISAWVGPFAVRFRHTWDSEYSVKLRQAADLLHRNAVLLRAEAQQQSIASNSNGTASIPRATMPGAGDVGGHRSPWNVLGEVYGNVSNYVGDVFNQGVQTLMGIEGIAKDLAELKYKSLGLPNVSVGPGFSQVAKGLGVIGIVLGAKDLIEGTVEHDAGKQTTGGISSAIPLVAKVPVVGAPVAIAASAALLYGTTVLPSSNEEYAGTYDMVMKRRFGDSYDPNNPTMEQAAYGTQRYEGFGGFLNSISDGMDYKLAPLFGGR